MSLHYRTAQERCEQAEADQEREFPQCPTCLEPIGWPGGCEGHEGDGKPEPVKTIGQLAAELRARLAVAS